MVAFAEQHQRDVDVVVACNRLQRGQQRLDQGTAPVPEAAFSGAHDRQRHQRFDTAGPGVTVGGDVSDGLDDTVCHPLRVRLVIAAGGHQPDPTTVAWRHLGEPGGAGTGL
ncbi:MAG: hypothetical protein PGN30_13435 [Mycolicibacterium neoaurum]|uniref:hypothetical protein n=1 Tax=Mycolicibacterium neoaurum TaxID=1795 RepID=UPI002FF7CF3E